MKLLLFEGYNDLQFFRSFLIKQMDGKIETKENKELISNFKNLLAENSEMAKVEIISINKCKILLLSVGGKDNFRVIGEGIRPLNDALKKIIKLLILLCL